MTCKKCIHKDVCAFRIPAEDEKTCASFKNELDYAEVKHGEWLPQNGGFFFLCSVCGKVAATKGNYCHSCGAKMDGVQGK